MSVNSEQDCQALSDSLVGLLQAQRRRFLGNLQKFIAAESTQWHLATMTAWYIVGAQQAHNALGMIARKRYVPSHLLASFATRFLGQALEDPGIASHKQGVSRLYFSRYSACDYTKADELFWHDLSCATSAGDMVWLTYVSRISASLTYEVWFIAVVCGSRPASAACRTTGSTWPAITTRSRSSNAALTRGTGCAVTRP